MPSPEDLPDQGLNPGLLCLLHWQMDSFHLNNTEWAKYANYFQNSKGSIFQKDILNLYALDNLKSEVIGRYKIIGKEGAQSLSPV